MTNSHEYTSVEALQAIMSRLEARDPTLAAIARNAINQGRDTQETVPDGRRGNRSYRRRASLTEEEALELVARVFHSNFLEVPRIINSALANLRLAVPSQDEEDQMDKVQQPQIALELQIPTQIAPADAPETLPLTQISEELLEQQEDNLNRLRQLLKFEQS